MTKANVITQDLANDLSLPLDKLSNPLWRITSGELYWIVVKDDNGESSAGKKMRFIPNQAQIKFIKRLWYRNNILKARQLGMCLDPNTRVLTANLQWVTISSLKAGDEVVAVDEFSNSGRGLGRKMRTATVIKTVNTYQQSFKITFDDGRSIICTENHPWLSKKTNTEAFWRSISGKGNEVTGKLKVGTKVRWITKPWGESDFDDGWFGGMLDGEGCISKKNTGAGINVSQREGEVWNRVVSYAKNKGYNACIENDKAERLTKYGKVPVPKLAFGRMNEMFRLIGQTRPTRFIKNRFWEGRDLPGKKTGLGWATITKIEAHGKQTMVDLQTSTGTYIAEGFVSHNTTLILIMWLDYALFNENSKCGVIAQTDDAAISLFSDKVKFAYENLPEPLRKLMPLRSDNAHEYLFAHNNSQIRVATSMRSGTYHRLHVSEFGKICAESPKKAKEVVSGSLQSVPGDGIVIIESTSEGIDGAHYNMTQAAIKLAYSGAELTKEQYRFNFFGWYEDEGYRLSTKGVQISEAKHDYFDSIESKTNITLDMEQRAWYVAKELSFIEAGIEETMLQEYPSTPEESFQVSLEGTYLSKQLTAMRKEGRIAKLPVLDMVCNTFWDIGGTAGTVIWVIQKVGSFYRCVDFYKFHSESFGHAVKWLSDKDYLYNKHFLPHDAGHEHQGKDKMETAQLMLEELGLRNTEIVPVISSLDLGIELLRKYFVLLQMDEVKCFEGIKDLDAYKKKFDTKQGIYRNEPEKHDGHSEAPDALRQWAQALHWNMINNKSNTQLTRNKTNWKTA